MHWVAPVIDCPDGDIGWEGVLMTHASWRTGSHTTLHYCAAWDSDAAKLGMQSCTPDRTTCTKLAARHLNVMSRSAGVLMMKRMKCDDEGGCSVFKVYAACVVPHMTTVGRLPGFSLTVVWISGWQVLRRRRGCVHLTMDRRGRVHSFRLGAPPPDLRR